MRNLINHHRFIARITSKDYRLSKMDFFPEMLVVRCRLLESKKVSFECCHIPISFSPVSFRQRNPIH